MKTGKSKNQIDLMLRAVCERTRLRILHALLGGELCVGDLVGILNIPQPTVSRHLGSLRNAGLVEVRKSGLWSYYSLADACSPFHKNLLDSLGQYLREIPELRHDEILAKDVLMLEGYSSDSYFE